MTSSQTVTTVLQAIRELETLQRHIPDVRAILGHAYDQAVSEHLPTSQIVTMQHELDDIESRVRSLTSAWTELSGEIERGGG